MLHTPRSKRWSHCHEDPFVPIGLITFAVAHGQVVPNSTADEWAIPQQFLKSFEKWDERDGRCNPKRKEMCAEYQAAHRCDDQLQMEQSWKTGWPPTPEWEVCVRAEMNKTLAAYPDLVSLQYAAASWIGHDVAEMVAVWGPPTRYTKGTDPVLDPTNATWVVSNEADYPTTEHLETSCNSSGHFSGVPGSFSGDTNCTTKPESDGPSPFERAFVIYRCNVTISVDQDTRLVAHAMTDELNPRKCAKLLNAASLVRPF